MLFQLESDSRIKDILAEHKQFSSVSSGAASMLIQRQSLSFSFLHAF